MMTARTQRPHLGKLSPRFKFFLNPYTDVRFAASCPECTGRIRQRKLPPAIHIDEWGTLVLNKTCRYCPGCDLLIAHQDEIESLMAAALERFSPASIGNKYLVVGTVERKHWRQGLTKPLTAEQMLAALHDFRDYVRFEPANSWSRDELAQDAGKPR